LGFWVYVVFSFTLNDLLALFKKGPAKLMDYTTIAQPWQQQSAPTVTLPVRPNETFFYKHNPRNWDFVKFELEPKGKSKDAQVVWRWLPTVDMERERAGVNGIRSNGRHADSTNRQAALTRDGWTILLPQNHDYMRVYPCRGGKYYDSKFNQLENIAGQMVTTFNRDEFNLWRLELLLNGTIKMPHPNILRRYVISKRRGFERYIRQQHIPELAARLESMRQEADLMQKEIDAIIAKGLEAYAIK
jgi:hypothetical protein